MSAPRVEGQRLAQGNLSRHPLARVIFRMYQRRLTGVLCLTGPGGKESRVYFRDGTPVAATLDSQEEHLGDVLLATGLIDEATHQESLRRMKQTGSRHGDVLRAMGAITEQQLTAALKLQLRRKLDLLFAAEEGAFEVYAGDHDFGRGAEAAQMRVHPRRIVYTGVGRRYTEQRLRREAGELGARPVKLATDALRSLDKYAFGQEDRAVADLLARGPADVSTVCAVTKRPPEAVRKVLYTLLVTDALEAPEAAPATAPPGAPGSGTAEWRVPAVRGGSPAARAPGQATTGSRAAVRPAGAAHAGGPPTTGSRAVVQPASAARAGGPPTTGSRAPLRPASAAHAGGPPTTGSRPAGAAPTGGRTAASAAAYHREIESKANGIEDQTLFEVLEVAPTATKAEVRAAYLKLARVFHPDRVPAIGFDEVRSKLDRIFARLSEAHATLCDDAQRTKYEESLSVGASGGQSRAEKILMAEMAFQKGVVLLRRRDFPKALEELGRAVDLNPDEGEHHAALAWTLYQSSPDKAGVAAEVKAMLQKAVELSPRCQRAHFYRGEIHMAEGAMSAALTSYQRVLAINPDDVDAQRAVRLIQMRADKESKKGGLFDRFRKK